MPQQIDKSDEPKKSGWRPRSWAKATDVSVSLTWELIAAGRLRSVKLGHARIILTSPAEFLESLKGAA